MKYKNFFIVPFLSFFFWSATASAQTDLKTVGSEVIPVDADVKIGKLANGLTYYIRKNTEPSQRAELYLVVKAGSLQENDDQKGLAHFTEHMAFNGTRSFPENELINYLQKAGVRFGADLNAYTSFDQTVYQLPLPTSNPELVETGFKILAEWAGHVSFDGTEIDKERGIIVEEERQRGKNVSERISNQLLPVLLANSRYNERLPIGDVNTIKSFKHETLKQYYKEWYRPDLQAIIAVGDFDAEKVENLIKENFEGLKSPAKPPELVSYTIPDNQEPLTKIVTDPEFPYTVASVMYKHPETVTKTTQDLRNSIIRSAASSMLAIRISDLVKSGKAPFLNASAGYGPYQGGMANLNAFTLQVVPKSPEQLQVAVEGLMDEVLKMQRFGFTQSELDRVKVSFMTSVDKSYKEKDKTSSKAYVNQYLKHYLTGEAIMSMDYAHAFYTTYLDGVTLEEVNEMAAGFVTNHNQIAIVQATEKSKGVLPTEAELLAWINNKQREVLAHVDDVINEPLLSEVLNVGTITKSKYNKALGATEITLSNGVKIVLKPTDFKNDEILFTAFSPGGYSLASLADIHSSKMANSIIASSGVGKFTSSQINRMLTGKSLAVGPYIGTYTEGFQGHSSPQDLETALQLTYLYFTQPRKDSTTFSRQIENARVAIEGKSANPMSVFQDTVNAVMKGRGPWATSMTLEQLEDVSLQKAYAFYQDRFADASDFTFMFVGNFEVDAIKPLLENYLGALPATYRKEKAKDVGIKPLTGRVNKKVYKGIEDKAVVVLSYHGDYKYTEENNLNLKVIKSALETRLLERLREKESGVYSPSVGLSYVKEPSPYYSISVSFSCSTERVDKLISATTDEIQKMQAEGPTEEEVAKFVAQEKSQLEVQLKANRFWLNHLEGVYAKRRDEKFSDTYQKRLDNINLKKTKKASGKYLSGEDMVNLVLLPEEAEAL
ncbi:pitrilysin family protein [uncultured Pontibacter sp.]|uniref:M16 family metallopeptidase n=1 Tax=uncultured Pontibacter sp. TaxID=453356 RepID=UPI002615E21E|nr:M16 family metallopeptidase [uncultured Pontibacter sp.]